ncbi:MAG: FGGY family carbohydrate kinase [Chitinophagaceae bacterium]
MSQQTVIAVFDVGKTNKKLLLFNEEYEIVYERTARFTEVEDEDGFPCENIQSLRQSVFDSLEEVLQDERFHLAAVQFATFGASWVYLGADGEPLTALYNYLKPFPEALQQQFYATYGGEAQFSAQTASPVLGSLNSGLQLYRIRHQQPEVFKNIQYALHLPQYLSYLLSQQPATDITSIGCHTGLWSFPQNTYHDWVGEEQLLQKFPSIFPCTHTFAAASGASYRVGIGLHDSSAALIPYLVSFKEPFLLLSSGTWCISLAPFNSSPLTQQELALDCLCYLQYSGSPVKAARLFAGNWHETGLKRISEHFNISSEFYKSTPFDPDWFASQNNPSGMINTKGLQAVGKDMFSDRNLHHFNTATEAYHQLIWDLVCQQQVSSSLVLTPEVKRIFVDGGFSNNAVYMNMLSTAFPALEVFAASMAQASALGSALAIHSQWNKKSLPSHLVQLKYYNQSHH